MSRKRTTITVTIGVTAVLILASLVFIGRELGHFDDEMGPGNDEHPKEPLMAWSFLSVFCLGIGSTLGFIRYYYPEFRERKRPNGITPDAKPLQVVRYVSTPAEVDVLDAITNLGNRAYKFEIARYTGLARMKVHRIVVRLSDRNVVFVEKEGRHVRVFLSEWLRPANYSLKDN